MLSFFPACFLLADFHYPSNSYDPRGFFQASGKAPNHASEEFQDCVVRLVSFIIVMLIKEFWFGK